MVIIMSWVNGIYEEDLVMCLVLVVNNNNLIYFNGVIDFYINNDGSIMLGQN